MKIGIFDSGIGGLLMARSIRRAMPQYDLVYFGDTLHLPYGQRSTESIRRYTQQAMSFLFENDCQLIIMACNTATSAALRYLQQSYLPENYLERRILGVVVPTLEHCQLEGYTHIGLIGTRYIVESGIYDQELKKINPSSRLVSLQTPLLVPMIENNGMKWIEPVLQDYFAEMFGENHTALDACILGCTHYIYLKDIIRGMLGEQVNVISQDEIVPHRLIDYLQRHPEIESKLSKNGQFSCYVTDKTMHFSQTAEMLYEEKLDIMTTEVA